MPLHRWHFQIQNNKKGSEENKKKDEEEIIFLPVFRSIVLKEAELSSDSGMYEASLKEVPLNNKEKYNHLLECNDVESLDIERVSTLWDSEHAAEVRQEYGAVEPEKL